MPFENTPLIITLKNELKEAIICKQDTEFLIKEVGLIVENGLNSNKTKLKMEMMDKGKYFKLLIRSS